MIKAPRPGRLTQGTVFCGGCAEEYSVDPVWGVVITARCDTTHDKVPVINYLPVVRVEDWLRCHGARIVLDRALEGHINTLKNYLKGRDLSESLLQVHTPSEISRIHFPVTGYTGKDKKAEKDEQTAVKVGACVASIDLIQNFLGAQSEAREVVQELLRTNSDHIKQVVKELISHKLAGYYFLKDLGTLTEHASSVGYVVILREVRHMPRAVANRLIEGIEKTNEAITGVSFQAFDFGYPISEIASPWVEHLMQCFCSLFGRIGIEDIDRAHIDLIANSALSKKE